MINKYNKKIVSWAIVILWMILIFGFSHQPREDSNKLSTNITEVIVEIIENKTSNRDINIRSFNHMLRKNAHFFLYLVLGILVTNALRNSQLRGYKLICLALLICILYAISDEIHQLFVPGRGGQVGDVFIDGTGSVIGITLAFFGMKAATEINEERE
ncbi:MAG: VanZ family protein [Tissierellaceae bacterium]|nr:VanZ family protein [Tissierellaceae bacterium]